MTLLALDIEKNWFRGSTVREINWDNLRDPMLAWSETLLLDINQLRIDVFGTTYSFDNDGLANIAQPIYDFTSKVSAVDWTFSGTVVMSGSTTFSGATNFTGAVSWDGDFKLSDVADDHDYIFSRPFDLAADRNVILPLLPGNDTFVFQSLSQPLFNKTITSSFVDGTPIGSATRSTGEFTTGNFNDDVTMAITKKLVLGSATAYISEYIADRIGFYVGGVQALAISDASSVVSIQTGFDLAVQSLQKVFLDGPGGGNYIFESVDNTVQIFSGGAKALTCNPNQHVIVEPLKKLFLDGGVDSYIIESASDQISFFTNDIEQFKIVDGEVRCLGSALNIQSGAALYLDGGGGSGDTYIAEPAANQIGMYVNNIQALLINDTAKELTVGTGFDVSVKEGQRVWFDGAVDTSIRSAVSNQINFEHNSITATSFNQFGVQLPVTDPPSANFGTRQGFVSAWIEFSDGGSSSGEDSYNVDAISDDDGDGHYDIAWDTNFTDGDYVVVGSVNIREYALAVSSSTGGLASVEIWRTSTLALTDQGFHVMAIGDQ